VAGLVLLEREHELAELAQAAREAAAGEGGLVLVSGEAGIGKSSLVRAVRGLLRPRRAYWSATATTWAPRGPGGRPATWSAASAPG
jgi:ABC-type transport system involved in cytochrome c biogenesis ATPase subunit